MSMKSLLNISGERPLLVVLGPTASGKTQYSLTLAREFKRSGRSAEIVNADSRQLYCGLDIGTAKVTSEERGDIPHHLLDVFDPKETVTAAKFLQMAEATIDGILERGNVPILVGGSMLYLSAIIDGLAFAPPVGPVRRRELQIAHARDGATALHRRLAEVDPEAAAAIDPRNARYLLRALEIVAVGKRPSEQSRRSSRYDLLILGMDIPRVELHRRITERTLSMLEAGWIDEVRRLKAAGYGPNDPAMQSHGYREIMAALEQSEVDVAALTKVIAAKSRQYARRQLTWWRGDPRIHWLQPSFSTS